MTTDGTALYLALLLHPGGVRLEVALLNPRLPDQLVQLVVRMQLTEAEQQHLPPQRLLPRRRARLLTAHDGEQGIVTTEAEQGLASIHWLTATLSASPWAVLALTRME